MPNITLSIRDEHTAIWDHARRHAETRHTSLSGLATMALTQYLNQEPTSDDIIVTARVDDEPTRVKFTGRWLVEPEDTDLDRADMPVRIRDPRAGVALTAKGRIAIYYQDPDGKAQIADFDSITEARRMIKVPVSDDEWSQAKQALQPPITLDI